MAQNLPQGMVQMSSNRVMRAAPPERRGSDAYPIRGVPVDKGAHQQRVVPFMLPYVIPQSPLKVQEVPTQNSESKQNVQQMMIPMMQPEKMGSSFLPMTYIMPSQIPRPVQPQSTQQPQSFSVQQPPTYPTQQQSSMHLPSQPSTTHTFSKDAAKAAPFIPANLRGSNVPKDDVSSNQEE